MQFDQENNVIKLCARGMEKEAEGKTREAAEFFTRAWNEAESDFEKFTAAHYVARHQKSVSDKLKWDETALNLALKLEAEDMKGTYPSLYLNVAKCYEDLEDFEKAAKHYQLALSYSDNLPGDGYGKLIKGGIMNGIARIENSSSMKK